MKLEVSDTDGSIIVCRTFYRNLLAVCTLCQSIETVASIGRYKPIVSSTSPARNELALKARQVLTLESLERPLADLKSCWRSILVQRRLW
jgi:hypothetical protein